MKTLSVHISPNETLAWFLALRVGSGHIHPRRAVGRRASEVGLA